VFSARYGVGFQIIQSALRLQRVNANRHMFERYDNLVDACRKMWRDWV
jgi:hypothetical protein